VFKFPIETGHRQIAKRSARLWRTIADSLDRHRSTTGFAALGAVAVLILWFLPKWEAGELGDITRRSQFTYENAARVTLAQIFGGLFLLIGLYFTWRRIGVAEEGQITERFTRAIEQLGNDKLEIRLGGIYALERIARDSGKDYWSIIEVLTAFVRERSLTRKGTASGLPPTSDIAAVLKVLRRRPMSDEPSGLDLTGASLECADLGGINLRGAMLGGVNLDQAILASATLDGAILCRASLKGTDLFMASMRGARCYEADLRGAECSGANLQGARLSGANMERTKLIQTDLSHSILVEAKMCGVMSAEANLSGSALQNCDLEHADLDGADLRSAILNMANLKDASLRGAKLTGAVFEYAILDNANFEGTDMRETRGLTQKQLESIRVDARTKLPSRLVRPRASEN
jgi:uncharacterized protein YjbI with pentapeptide repeats